jgi:hypothetical protein
MTPEPIEKPLARKVPTELLPQSETRFFERLSGMPVTFSRGAQGKATGLTVYYQGKAIRYDRISDQPPRAPDPPKPRVAIELDTGLLDAVVGQYELALKAPFPKGAKVTIWREGDQLVGQAQGENTIPGAFDIYPPSETNFFIKLNGAQLTVIKDDQGQVTSVIHHSSQAGVPDSVAKRLRN